VQAVVNRALVVDPATLRQLWRLVPACAALSCVGCHDDVVLGSWVVAVQTNTPSDVVPTATGAPEAGVTPVVVPEIEAGLSDAGGPPPPPPTATTAEASAPPAPLQDAGSPPADEAGLPGLPELPACGEVGEPGAFNTPGNAVGATGVVTDWIFPTPVESQQWDLMIEQDVEPKDPGALRKAGYYWQQVFSFEEGVSGRLGLQSEGGYQLLPPAGAVEFTKMAAFWLSGPPLDAELGDISYPDARVGEQTAAGVDWYTIHAKFEWEECHVYQLRVAPHAVDTDGIWYGAWINDKTSGEDTFLGRMLLPPDVGLMNSFVSSRSDPIDYELFSCPAADQVSAVFGAPTTVQGDSVADVSSNRFDVTLRCGGSRSTPFAGAVRHELSWRP